MADDARPDDADSEEIVDLIAVDPRAESAPTLADALEFPAESADPLGLTGVDALFAPTPTIVAPPPPPPAASGAQGSAASPVRGNRRPGRRSSVVVTLLCWGAGGVLGTGLAFFVLWFWFGRDPSAVFAVASPSESREPTKPSETRVPDPNAQPPKRPVRTVPKEDSPTTGARETEDPSTPETPAERPSPDASTAAPDVVAVGEEGDATPDADSTEVAVAASAEPPFENTVGMKMVFVHPGEFQMGSTKPAASRPYDPIPQFEFPQHRVKITKGFYLSSCEVTNAQFREFIQETGAGTRSSVYTSADRPNESAPSFTPQHWRGSTAGDSYPVLSVQWPEAVAFAAWLSRKEGRRYRLPTEAEWEYACRAGTQTTYSFGDSPESLAEYANVRFITFTERRAFGLPPIEPGQIPPPLNEHELTRPVGQLKPNAFGLYDMHGNAEEWCADWFSETYYAESPIEDPTGPESGEDRVIRGGSYSSSAKWCRSSSRSRSRPEHHPQSLGFRLACDFGAREVDGTLAADGRRKTPSAAVLASVTERFDELYREEIASASAAQEKTELSRRFYEESKRLADSLDDRFVLLRKSYDLSIESGDYPGARRAADELTRDYDVDPLVVEAHLIKRLAETTRLNDHRASILDHALELSEDLIDAGRFPEADATIAVVKKLAADLGDPSASSKASELAIESASAAETWRVASQAKSDLEKNPDDPAANLIYGRHLSLRENDWRAAAEHLVKVDDDSIRTAATLEQKRTNRYEDQVALADAWYDVLEEEPLRQRALYWYGKARNALAGLERARVERRFEELSPPATTARAFVTSTGIKMALIPAGEFQMGSTPEEATRLKELSPIVSGDFADQQPRHPIRIAKPFYMSVHEVTVEQFAAFVRDSNYRTQPEVAAASISPAPPTWLKPGISQSSDHPVVCVAWLDANAFTEWLSRKEGRAYRLPTEAEWEYACRAGSETTFSFDDDVTRLILFGNGADKAYGQAMGTSDGRILSESDGYAYTAPVGSFAPNAFGLHDMHGNVAEWCGDQYDERYYKYGRMIDPKNSDFSHPSNPVYRGGSWSADLAKCASAARSSGTRSQPLFDVGFRLVLETVDERRQPIVQAASPKTSTGAASGTRIGLPVPTKEAQDAAQTKLVEIYRAEFDAAQSLEGKAALAETLYAQRDRVADAPPDRFVLLRNVRDLAIESGEAHQAELAVDELIRVYDVDELAARTHLLKTLAETCRSSTERRYVGRAALKQGWAALEERRFDDVQAFLEIVAVVYEKTRNPDLKEMGAALANELQTTRATWPRILEAERTLQEDPDDAEANDVFGRYLCLSKGDWTTGLPLLAKSSDEAVKRAAERDLAMPKEALVRLAAANAWYEIGFPDGGDKRFLARARYWYQRVLVELTGLEKLTAEKRIADIDALLKPLDPLDEGELALGRGDLWDIAGLKTASASNVEYGSPDDNMFGATIGAPRDPADRDATLFAKAAGGYVHRVDFTTLQPVNVGRIAVHLRHDPDGKRAAERVRVYGYDPDVGEYILVLDHALAMPYRGTEETRSIKVDQGSDANELKLSAKIRRGTAMRFRVEFVLRGDPKTQHDGVRVVELDAYPD